MIPIIVCPVLNRGDLLYRMIRSIDYPVAVICIINNGYETDVSSVIQQLLREGDYPLHIHTPYFNLGVAGSWNWTMKNFPADYWLFVGNDIQFSKGDLKKIDTFVQDNPQYVMCPANWGHSLFALRPSCIDGAGYFDENFYPAYSEDQDHCYRITLAGLPWADCPNVKAVHGEPPLWGSSTVWSDPTLNKMCSVTQKNNHEFYRRKWGGDPGEEQFIHPFNNPKISFKDWVLDTELAAANENPSLEIHYEKNNVHII
jgi:hypothetical protein